MVLDMISWMQKQEHKSKFVEAKKKYDKKYTVFIYYSRQKYNVIEVTYRASSVFYTV